MNAYAHLGKTYNGTKLEGIFSRTLLQQLLHALQRARLAVDPEGYVFVDQLVAAMERHYRRPFDTVYLMVVSIKSDRMQVRCYEGKLWKLQGTQGNSERVIQSIDTDLAFMSMNYTVCSPVITHGTTFGCLGDIMNPGPEISGLDAG